MSKRRVVGCCSVLALCLILLWPRDSERTDAESDYTTPLVDASSSGSEGEVIVVDSEFSKRYPDSGGSVERDLMMVNEIWQSAIQLVKDFDRLPMPDNEAITRFLQGENNHGVAWIRPGHPSVSRDGELLDRWGSPLFFHRESSRMILFRSAGPDREVWTEDDIVWPK